MKSLQSLLLQQNIHLTQLLQDRINNITLFYQIRSRGETVFSLASTRDSDENNFERETYRPSVGSTRFSNLISSYEHEQNSYSRLHSLSRQDYQAAEADLVNPENCYLSSNHQINPVAEEDYKSSRPSSMKLNTNMFAIDEDLSGLSSLPDSPSQYAAGIAQKWTLYQKQETIGSKILALMPDHLTLIRILMCIMIGVALSYYYIVSTQEFQNLRTPIVLTEYDSLNGYYELIDSVYYLSDTSKNAEYKVAARRAYGKIKDDIKYYKRVPFAEIRDYVYNKYDPIVWNYVLQFKEQFNIIQSVYEYNSSNQLEEYWVLTPQQTSDENL